MKTLTDCVSGVSAVRVNEFGVDVVPGGNFVVHEMTCFLPAREVMQSLQHDHVEGSVGPIGVGDGKVHAAVDILGDIDGEVQFDSWKTSLERLHYPVAADLD